MVERSILGLGMEETVARTGWMESEVLAAGQKLEKASAIRVVSKEPLFLVAQAQFQEVTGNLLSRLQAFHKENPLLPGIPREELRAAAGQRVRTQTFRAAIEELTKQNKIALQGDLVKKPGSEITLTAEETEARLQIEQAFASAGLKVPSAQEVLTPLALESNRAEKILQILLRDKTLIRVSPELIFHRDALGRLPEILQNYKKSKGPRIGVPTFKELTGITRKYAIPLLEYLDRQRLTRRTGDERVIL
jgi:selenocysteine-specific elongation factor